MKDAKSVDDRRESPICGYMLGTGLAWLLWLVAAALYVVITT